MRRFIIVTSGIVAALTMGVVAVDAQRGRGGNEQRPAIERGNQDQRGPAFARNGRGGRGGPAGFGPGVDLTDNQQASIQELRAGARDQSAPIADDLLVTRRALHRAVYADQVNEAEIGELAAKVATLEQQLAGIRLANEQAIAGVLTAEQKEIVRTRPQRGPRGGGGPGRGR